MHDADEWPFHQAPLSFDRAATSDVHFNDGYFFMLYGEGTYLAAGLRLHPNMNVLDGFVGLSAGGEQRTLRLSRPLRPNYSETAVGPLALRIVEPMKSIHLTLAERAVDLSFDLRFESVATPFVETPSQHVRHGRLINDVIRYIHVCRASGTVTIENSVTNVDSWFGLRDHSWGIRSSMGPRTRHGGTEISADEMDRRRFRIWVPFEVEGHAGFFHTHEDQSGNPLDFEGSLYFEDGSTAKLVSVEHELQYHAGTHNIRSGKFSLLDEHSVRRDYAFEPSGSLADVQGFGYHGGWHDGQSAGIYRGDTLVVESDRYSSDPAPRKDGPRSRPRHEKGRPD